MERCERVIAAKNLLWVLERPKYRYRLYGLCTWAEVGGIELVERGEATFRERTQSNYLLGELFKEWPEHSGDHLYPVPSLSDLSPEEAYIRCKNKYSLFTRYGRARRRLLKFIKNRCREIIQEG